MFENFSEEALKVIQLATEESLAFGHDIVGTEHLLLGIITNDTCLVSRELKTLGITRSKAREEAFRITGNGAVQNSALQNYRQFATVNSMSRASMEFTHRAKELFRLAKDSTSENREVDSCALMLALLTIPRCTAHKVLNALDLDLKDLDDRIKKRSASHELSDSQVTTSKLDRIINKLKESPPAKKESTESPIDENSRNHLSEKDNPEKSEKSEKSEKILELNGFTGTFSTSGMVEAVDTLLGTTIDKRYQVIEQIGKGGMGSVYRVKHLVLHRDFAIKVLHPYLASDEKSIRRFQLEAQAASKLTHPGLAAVFDWSMLDDGRPYIVMSYIDGVRLSDVLQSGESLDLPVWLSIFIQIADALNHAHNLGVLHRDLKPGNIMLAKNDSGCTRVKIVDFGIAKLLKETSFANHDLTETGEVFGSPLYMSPEQCTGSPVDVRSDIYTLGVVMYETLQGSNPFFGRSLYDTMSRQINHIPDSFQCDSYPDSLVEMILSCLAKNPDERIQSMSELKARLIEISLEV